MTQESGPYRNDQRGGVIRVSAKRANQCKMKGLFGSIRNEKIKIITLQNGLPITQ